MLRAAGAAVGWLVLAGLVSPFAIAFALGLTGLGKPLAAYIVAGIIVLGAAIGGGAQFGRVMARLAGAAEPRRLAWAGGLGYGPVTIAMGVLLGVLEPVAVRAAAPLHVVFALMFAPAAGLVVAVVSVAFGIALRSGRLAAELALKAGAAAGLAFLAADLIQDLLGRRVGGPDAAATATMVTVTVVGCVAAAAAGGAVMLLILRRHAARVTT